VDDGLQAAIKIQEKAIGWFNVILGRCTPCAAHYKRIGCRKIIMICWIVATKFHTPAGPLVASSSPALPLESIKILKSSLQRLDIADWRK